MLKTKRINQPSTQTIVCTHMNTARKMPKYNNTKNCITDLAITNQKTKQTTQEKVQTSKTSTIKTRAHAQSCNLQAKVHEYQKMRLQTWPKALANRKIPKTTKKFKTKI